MWPLLARLVQLADIVPSRTLWGDDTNTTVLLLLDAPSLVRQRQQQQSQASAAHITLQHVIADAAAVANRAWDTHRRVAAVVGLDTLALQPLASRPPGAAAMAAGEHGEPWSWAWERAVLDAALCDAAYACPSRFASLLVDQLVTRERAPDVAVAQARARLSAHLTDATAAFLPALLAQEAATRHAAAWYGRRLLTRGSGSSDINDGCAAAQLLPPVTPAPASALGKLLRYAAAAPRIGARATPREPTVVVASARADALLHLLAFCHERTLAHNEHANQRDLFATLLGMERPPRQLWLQQWRSIGGARVTPMLIPVTRVYERLVARGFDVPTLLAAAQVCGARRALARHVAAATLIPPLRLDPASSGGGSSLRWCEAVWQHAGLGDTSTPWLARAVGRERLGLSDAAQVDAAWAEAWQRGIGRTWATGTDVTLGHGHGHITHTNDDAARNVTGWLVVDTNDAVLEHCSACPRPVQ